MPRVDDVSDLLLNTQQLAEALGARIETIYAWRNRGWITPEGDPAGQLKYRLSAVIDRLTKRGAESTDGRTKYAVGRFLEHIAKKQS